MEYRLIQVANCEDAAKRIVEATKRHDKEGLKLAEEALKATLDAIKNADQATYEKYSPYLSNPDTP